MLLYLIFWVFLQITFDFGGTFIVFFLVVFVALVLHGAARGPLLSVCFFNGMSVVLIEFILARYVTYSDSICMFELIVFNYYSFSF